MKAAATLRAALEALACPGWRMAARGDLPPASGWCRI